MGSRKASLFNYVKCASLRVGNDSQHHAAVLWDDLSLRFCFFVQEALSVVSEDQSLFECAYGTPHLAKTEMTASSSSDYGQTSKMSPRVPQQDWLSQPPARVTIKMECNPSQVNGSR